jgi:segregation and condensation protein A
LVEAREALERLLGTGQAKDWMRLDHYLIAYMAEPGHAATVMASSFAAPLELVREGEAELHQAQAFAPLYMRKHLPVREVYSNPDAPGRTGLSG